MCAFLLLGGLLFASNRLSASPPTDGLKLWISADIGVTTNPVTDPTTGVVFNSITRWADQSGNNNDIIPGNGGPPTPVLANNVVNGEPTAQFGFNGSIGVIGLAGFMSGESGGEIYAVLRSTGAGGGPWSIGGGSFGMLYPNTDDTLWDNFGSTVRYSEGTPAQDLTQFHLYEARSHPGKWDSAINGLPLFHSETNTVSFPGGVIFGLNTSNGAFLGDIAEVLIYNRGLSDSERLSVRMYLAAKYALQPIPTATGVTAVGLGSAQNLVTWNWVPTNSATWFVVERKAGSSGIYSQIATVEGGGTFLDDSITPGQDYFYRVLPVNLTATGSYSAEVEVTSQAGSQAFPVSGMALWLMADGVQEGVITHWPDFSGNGNDGLQSNLLNQPLWLGNALNGKPVIHFSSGDTIPLPNLLNGATAAEAFILVRAASATGENGLWSFSPNGGYYAMDGVVEDGFGSSTLNAEGVPSQDLTQFHVYEVSSQAGLWQSWLDGVPIYRSTTNSVVFSPTPVIGLGSANFWFTGDIAEIVVYNRTLSDAERLGALAYFDQKYTLALTPAAPTGVTVTEMSSSENVITWQWQETDSETLFSIERKTGVNGAYVQIGIVTNTGTFIDTSAVSGHDYFYRVRAISPNGVASSYSAAVELTVPAVDPGNVPTSGMALWLMADGLGQDRAGYWPDFSGNGNGGLQPTQGLQPTLLLNALNGRPALHFAGQQYVTLPNLLNGAAAAEAMIVVRTSSVTVDSGMWAFGTGGGGLFSASDGTIWDGFGTSSWIQEGTPSQDLTQFHVYQVSSKSGLWQSWLDGIPLYRSTTNSVAFTSTPTIGLSSTFFKFHGDIAEVIVYNRALGDSERQAGLAYLQQKYGLTFTPAAPTAAFATALSATEALVSWQWHEANTETIFSVERKIGSGGTYAQVGTVTNSGTFTDTNAPAGNDYFYRVRALSPAGVPGLYSNEAELFVPVIESGSVATSGMKLWLMADGLGQDRAEYWADSSGNGNGAWQMTAAQQPTLSLNAINGKPVLHFSGTQYLQLPNFLSGSSGAEALIVVRATSTTTAAGLWAFGTNGGYYTMADGTVQDGFGSTSFYTQGPASQNLTQFHVYEVSSQAGLWQSWVDGVPFYESNVNTVGFTATPTLGLASTFFKFNGDIAEVIVYNRSLTDTERQADLAYLQQKYALSVAPAAPSALSAAALSPSEVWVSWKWLETNTETNFAIERKTGASGTYAQIGTVTDTGTFLDTTAVSGADYFYRVRSFTPSGLVSAYSAEAELLIPAFEAGSIPFSGLKMWLMADGLGQDRAEYVPDFSGNGNGAWQSSQGQQPVLQQNVLNGKPVLHFGGSQYLNLPYFLNGAPASEVLVVTRSTGVNSGLWTIGSGGGAFYPYSDGTVWDAYGSSSWNREATPSQDVTQFHIYEVSSQQNLWQTWIDGVPLFQMKTNTPGFYTSPLLGLAAPFYYYTGDIAEILIYNRALGDLERRALRSYLTDKYALLPVPPTPTGLQANSINPDSVLLTWNAGVVGLVETYVVWRQAGTGPWEIVASVDRTCTYFDQGLDPNTSYNYEIQAYNYRGASTATLPVAVNTKLVRVNDVPFSGLKLWLMADGVEETHVEHWTDYSGNGNDAWQTTGANQPTLLQNAINGKSVVHFAGNLTQYVSLPDILHGATAAEVLVVLRAASNTTIGGLWTFGSAGAGAFYPYSDGTIWDSFGSTWRSEGSPSDDLTEFHIYEVTSQPNLWESWIDGIPLSTSTTNTVGVTSSPALGLGGSSSSGPQYGFSGDIAEILIYNRPLSDYERTALRQYLAIKYLLPRFDPDGDGLTTKQELALGTNPINSDTNGDGIMDGISLALGINPITSNSTDPFLNTPPGGGPSGPPSGDYSHPPDFVLTVPGDAVLVP